MIRNESVWTLAVHFISVLSFISTGTALTRPSAATSFDGEKFAVAEPASSRSSSANHTATHGGAASSSSSSAAPTTLLTLNLGDSPFRADLTSATLEVAASHSHPRRTAFLPGSGKDEQKESTISVHGYPGGTMPFHLPPTHSIQSSTFPRSLSASHHRTRTVAFLRHIPTKSTCLITSTKGQSIPARSFARS